MNSHKISSEQAENYEADGFGKTKSPDGDNLIKVWISVRQDSQIPEFDAITDFKYYADGFDDLEAYNEKIAEILTEGTGLFVEDALKLKTKDIRSMMGEEVSPGDEFKIATLAALKKAICDYFEKTEQMERKRKATERIICRCRYVSDLEIEDAAKKGQGSYEFVSKLTGAGTGCQSCVSDVKAIIDRSLKN